jgi:hypothetical protein
MTASRAARLAWTSEMIAVLMVVPLSDAESAA